MDCFLCQTEMLRVEDGALVCTECGFYMDGFLFVGQPTVDHITRPSYKRSNHLKKIMAQYPEIKRSEALVLQDRFHQLQRAFEKQRGKRKNMLPYQFVLHKLCELLGYNHLTHLFRVSKSASKLQQQTQLWDSICKYLHWS